MVRRNPTGGQLTATSPRSDPYSSLNEYLVALSDCRANRGMRNLIARPAGVRAAGGAERPRSVVCGFADIDWRQPGRTLIGTVLGMATGMPLPTLPVTISGRGGQEERQRLTRRARRLTELGLAWHALEAAVAIAAGVTAGSVALVGFGADRVIEAGAGLVVLWLVTGERLSSHSAERRAQQVIAASFLMLSLYVTIESARDLIGGHHPAVSWVGVAL